MKMSFIRKQTSRLNSLDEGNCNCLSDTNSKCPAHLKLEAQNKQFLKSKKQEAEETECHTFTIELEMVVSRTALLIQDYLEFKAARSIQRFVRGWLYRGLYKRKRRAAIVIQAEWRRFYGQRLYFKNIETELQRRIEQHFFTAAQKIQASWRGWWVRRYVHDLTHLKHVQVMAGEDLLNCVAFKLHHLLRTHQIPGVYSLRNSNALSKVEHLLASLRFKEYNEQTRQRMRQHCRERQNAEKQHTKSTFGIKIPFPKVYIDSKIKEKCSTLRNARDADARMTKIIQMYEEENRLMTQKQAFRKAKYASYKKEPLINRSPSEISSFCGDVVKSMKKWQIITEKNLTVDSTIFKNPENVENFLKEIASKLSVIEKNPNCGSQFLWQSLKQEGKCLETQEGKNPSLIRTNKEQNSTLN